MARPKPRNAPHVLVAQLPVKNRPETGSPRGCSFSTPAGWFFARAKHAPCCVSPKCALSCPHAEEQRSATRAQVLPPLKPRCDASLSMRANALACPHPSRRAHARSRWRHDLAYALLRMRTDIACCKPHRLQHSPSRSRGAVLRPGFASLLRQPGSRGGRSAERRSGAAAPVGHAMTRRVRRLRGALRPMTQQYTGRNSVTISMPDGGSVPIVSQTEIDPMKTALSLMLARHGAHRAAAPTETAGAGRLQLGQQHPRLAARSPALARCR
jgi:hypothetical protein